jgi:hypothetical protein
MPIIKYIGVLLMALGLCGCPKETSVWLAPGATSQQIEFILGESRGEQKPIGIAVLRVDRCSEGGAGANVWLIEADEQAPEVASVIYGRVPQGFRQREQASPIRPGCYSVAISGAGRMTFTVDSAGGVQEGTK